MLYLWSETLALIVVRHDCPTVRNDVRKKLHMYPSPERFASSSAKETTTVVATEKKI